MNTQKGSGYSSFLAEAHGTGARHNASVRFHTTNAALARKAEAAANGNGAAGAGAGAAGADGQRWASASTSSFSTTERNRLRRSFNLSAETGIPKHMETIGDRAAARTAALLSQSQRSDAFNAAAAAGAGAAAGGEAVGGARKRAKSAGAPGASADRYCPIGSRPRYTFSSAPEHLKYLPPRPRHALPEDPFTLTSYATPYRSHPAYTATRAVCLQYRAEISDAERKAKDDARVAALIARYGSVTAARGQMQITGGAGSKGRGRAAVATGGNLGATAGAERLPTASAPPPPHLPANPNSPTFRFPRRIAYDPSDFEDFSKRSGRGDTFYRPLSVEEHRHLASHKVAKGASAGSGQW